MIKRNPYLQHTYESLDQSVSAPRRQSEDFDNPRREYGGGRGFSARLRSPVFATAALLLAGAAFAAIIYVSYPRGDAGTESLPVITADASPFKEAPTEPGGMDVPHQDSTIFNTIRSAELEEVPPIENLLSSEAPVDASAALAAQEPAGGIPAEALQPAGEPSQETLPTVRAAEPVVEAGAAGLPEVKIAETRAVQQEIQKIPPALVDATAEKPDMQAPATAPETLAYVRSVLEKKDAEKAAAAKPAAVSSSSAAAIEPAAGAATSAGTTITPGNYFAQVASFSSESAAPTEWKKLQKSFSALSGVSYRVQRADLGERGIYYRIQAGPMSKESASGLCTTIKTQKPGGCLVVQ